MFSFLGRGRGGVALAALILAAGLAGCGSTPKEPIIRTQIVKVPTPISCVPDALRAAPAYPDTDKALRDAPGPGERYQLVQAGRLLRDQRLAEVEPVIAGCRLPGDAPPR